VGWLDKAAHAFRQWPHVAQLPELQLPQLLLPSLMLLLPGELKPLITRPGPCPAAVWAVDVGAGFSYLA